MQEAGSSDLSAHYEQLGFYITRKKLPLEVVIEEISVNHRLYQASEHGGQAEEVFHIVSVDPVNRKSLAQ